MGLHTFTEMVGNQKYTQHLGPHGLWMTEAIATKFGEKAKLQNRLQKGVPLGDGWGGIGKGVFKGYWHGWFE